MCQAKPLLIVRYIVIIDPLREAEFILFKPDRCLLCQITEKAHQKVLVKSPWLTLIITDVFDLKTYLFHHFAPYRLLCRLPDLCKSRDQCISFIFPIRVFRHHDPVSVHKSDDDGRCDLWEHQIATGRTPQHTFLRIMHQLVRAASAKTVIPIPSIQMPPCRCRIHLLLRMHSSYRKKRVKGKSAKLCIFWNIDQKIILSPHLKQINTRRHRKTAFFIKSV